MWFVYLLIGILVLGVLGWAYERARKLGYIAKIKGKSDAKEPEKPRTGFFPCILEGNVSMPPMAAVIKAARIDVEKAKDYLTSRGKYRPDLSDEECMTLCSAPVKGHPNWDGVNEFGGGGDYGGRYLVGAFHFEIDANGQRIDETSWLSIFNADRFKVSGGITGDGAIGMACMPIGGTPISGKIVDGKIVDGRVTHGDGKTWVYGVMNGTYRKV